MSLTFTDIFCGAGGSSIGLTGAGFELKLAANHWARAIETHSANFRNAEHLCADVNNYDMRRLPRTDVLWASPICTEISPAGGRRRRGGSRGQLDLFDDGSVAAAAFDRTRATAYDVIRATEVHRYTAVLIENVVEFATDWELFDWWLDGMVKLGYNRQIVSVSTAHVGGADNPWAPQWRDRLYIVFTRTGIPLPDVAPRPVAWCPTCDAIVHAVQSWKDPRRPKIGKYRQQYVYRCPNVKCRHAEVEPYVAPAAAAIDWSDVGQRIGDRSRPLAAATLRRINAGLDLFARPVMVNANHDDDRMYPADGMPLPSRTTKIGDGLACPPILVPAGGTWNDTASPVDDPMRTRTARETEGLCVPAPFLTLFRSGRPRAIGVDEPLATIVGSGSNHAVVTPEPFITVLRNNATAQPIDEPLATVTTGGERGGGHQYLTVPDGAFYVKNYSGRPQDRVRPVSDPLGTITTSRAHSLVIPYRRGARATTTREPLHTLHTRDSAGLLRTAIEVDDCHFRMLKPREHLRAQRFPDTYVVHGNKGEQTMQAGNAVSANVAQWIGQQVAKVLGGGA
jgi:DNA (cytosine-5)-methyltransferase 1